jgi:hypothetical protein
MRLRLKKIFPLFSLCSLIVFVLCASSFAQNKNDVTAAVEEARNAGVTEQVLNRMLAFGYKYKLRATEMSTFVNITREAKQENIPIDPFVDKIEEGLAKRVRTQIIQRVLQKELSQYRFVRKITHETMNRWGVHKESLRSSELTRLSKTLSMGISEPEMKGFFSRAPQSSLTEIADAMEFMAALKQAHLQPEIAEEIVLNGLKEGFFSKTAWSLPLMVDSAKTKKLSDAKIKSAAMEVVKGRKSVLEAHVGLGLDPKDLARGPQFSGPQSESAGKGKGTGAGKGHLSGPGMGGVGHGGPDSGSGGHGGSGSAGSGSGGHGGGGDGSGGHGGGGSH